MSGSQNKPPPRPPGIETLLVTAGRDTAAQRGFVNPPVIHGSTVLYPAVLLLVAPPQRKVEVVTAPAVRERIPDEAAAEAVTAMVERFRDGDLSGGLIAGIERLATAAGPGTAGPDDEELPDVLGG